MCSGCTDYLCKTDHFLFQFHCGVNTVLSSPVSPELIDSSLSRLKHIHCLHLSLHYWYFGHVTLSQLSSYCKRYKCLYTAYWKLLSFVTLSDTIRSEKVFSTLHTRSSVTIKLECVHTTGIMECLYPFY